MDKRNLWRGMLLPVLILAVITFLKPDVPEMVGIFSNSVAQAYTTAPKSVNSNIMVANNGTVTFNAASSNVAKIAISSTTDFGPVSWQTFDEEKFKTINQGNCTYYVKFMTKQGVVSEVIVFTPQFLTLNEGDIVKTKDNPDVYIIKYKGGKQYIRLILSPAVFNSYRHLKWENIKIITQEQMDTYTVSSLVQVAGDSIIYQLFPNGDEGERRKLDTSQSYDADSVYEINSADRDSYQFTSRTPITCSGSATRTCAVEHGTGLQTRTCGTGAVWSDWGSCVPNYCDSGYEASGNSCVPGDSNDTKKPTITSFNIPSSSSSLTISITSFTATDNVAVTGYAFTESNTAPALSSFSSTKPTSHTFSTSGYKVLYAWVRDAAGNISYSFNDSVSISIYSGGGGGGGSSSSSDTTAPTVTAFTIPSTATSLTVSVSSFTATDSVGVTGYMLTESSSAPSASSEDWTSSAPSTHTFTTQGSKTLYAWAKDAAGNVSSSLNDSVTITIADTTAPTVTAFVIPSTSSSLTVSISTFTATDAVGVTGYMLTESSSAPSASSEDWTSSAPSTHTFTTQGSKTLYAWAKDAAGNVSSSLNDSVTVDTTAPTVTAFTIPSTATSLTVSVSSFTATDSVGVTGYMLTESSSAPSSSAAGWTSSAPSTHTFTTQGSKTLYAWAKDAAGNVSSSLNDSVTITISSDYITGAMSTSASVIFLHHSTGGGVWNGGVSEEISAYNTSNSTSYSIVEDWYQQNTGNYPYDYWNSWVNHAGDTAYNGDDTLEILTQTYDVIVFKHCFPVSSIGADTGSPDIASSNQTLENYYLQYAALKEKMHEFPDKRFIVWTGAALTQASTSEASAIRAQTFFNWVKNTWDEDGDNIYVWDFWELETEGGLYLLDDYASSAGDSHPTGDFNNRVAPYFAQRIINVIEGNGDTTSITGE